VTGGMPIAVLLQSISGVSAINPLVTFYDIHRGKREVLIFYFVPVTTQDKLIKTLLLLHYVANFSYYPATGIKHTIIIALFNS
jgi:hypothetical protein